MVSNFTESMRANFSQLRELQATFNDSIVNLCVATVDRIMKGELEDEFPDDTREVNLIVFFFFVVFYVHVFSYLRIKIQSRMLVKHPMKFIEQKSINVKMKCSLEFRIG